jgi:hypothetical protein
MPDQTTTHEILTGWTPNNHGYPYRASCSCGWQSLGYVTDFAAEIMADEHRKEVAAK